MVKKDCRSNSGAIIFLFLLIFQSFYLSAQVEISDSLIIERVQLIQKMLNEGKPNANLWWYGWLAGYSAATIGQGAVYFSSNDKGTKQDMALGGFTTLLGAVGQLLTPMVSGYAPDRLSQIPEDNHDALLKKLDSAEVLLKESALREKNGRSWQAHAVTGLVNVSSGLITWLGFKRSLLNGVGNFALNTLVTEVQIWTQPTRAKRDYQNYCKKYKSGIPPVTLKPDLNWFVGVSSGVIQIKIVF
jgi:hypothetical protein